MTDLQLSSLGGESYDSGSTVRGVGLADEIATCFEVADELVHGLLGDLHLVGDFGQAAPVERRVAEQGDVGWLEVVVAGPDDSFEVLGPDPLPHETHRCPDVPGPFLILTGHDGQVTLPWR